MEIGDLRSLIWGFGISLYRNCRFRVSNGAGFIMEKTAS